MSVTRYFGFAFVRWNETHETMVSLNTRARRSRRLRRCLRAAKKGDMELALRWLMPRE